MKKMMLAIAALAIVGESFAQTGYKMTGTIEGVNEGNIYLIRAAKQGGLDTLARSTVQQGKFEFSGMVEKPDFTRVYLEGNYRTVTFFLENTDYTAKINLKGTSRIEGGYEQSVLNELNAIRVREEDRKAAFMKELTRVETKEQADSLDELRGFTKIIHASQIEEDNVIRFNPHSMVAASAIQSGMNMYVIEFTKRRYAMLSEKGKATPWGKTVREFIAMRDRTDVGCTAPDFTLTDLKGKPFNMYGVEGKVKVLVFWQPDQKGSREANRILEELYQEYHDKGLEIVNVIQNGDRKAVSKIVKEDKLTYKQGIVAGENLDAMLKLYGALILTDWPLFVLDSNNKIIYKAYYINHLKRDMPNFFK